MPQIPHPLVDADDSVLVIIDVQDHFLTKLEAAAADTGGPLLERICWLVDVANWLGIPTVATAEDIPHLGTIPQHLVERLGADAPVHNKMVFGLAGDPAIVESIEQTPRTTFVLVGLETDVCVAHSALGLMERGHRVVVVDDATGSPGAGHESGLQRIRESGGSILSVKGLFYEWTRTVDRASQFRLEHPDVPESLSL